MPGGFPYDQPYDYGRETTRVQCGYPLEVDGSVMCRNTAPCPIHRDRRIGETAAEARERQELEALLNAAADPAPGLYEVISGESPPTFAEMRERYGDPQGLNPIPKYDPDAPADLHEQLHADDQPWSVRSRLAKSLGRRALATRLADALPPLLGAELADRLDTLVTQAVTEAEAAMTQAISDRYYEARAALDADAEQKLKEVHDERYRRPSRFS